MKPNLSVCTIVLVTLIIALCTTFSTIPLVKANFVEQPFYQDQNVGRIAFIQDGNIWVINPDGSGKKQLTTLGNYSSPIWSPNGSQIAFIQTIKAPNGKDAWQIGTIDINTKVTRIVLFPENIPFTKSGEFLQYSNPRWTNDSEYLLYINFEGMVHFLSTKKVKVSDGRIVTDFKGFYSPGFDISPVDNTIVSMFSALQPPFGDGLDLYSQDGNKIRSILPIDKGGSYQLPRFSPDGKQIAYTSFDSSTRNYSISAINRDGSNQSTLYAGDEKSIQGFAWSPDGKNLVVDSSGTLRLVNLDTHLATDLVSGTQPDWGKTSSTGNTNPISTEQPPVASTNGLIAFLGFDENIYLISTDGTGLTQLTFDGNPSQNNWDDPIVGYRNINWSPDGIMLGMTRIGESGSRIQAIRMSDHKVIPLISNTEGSFDWLPDSRSIIYSDVPYEEASVRGDQPGGLSILDINTGKITSFIDPGPGFRLTNPHWAANGDHVFFRIDVAPRPQGVSGSWLGIKGSSDKDFIQIQNTDAFCDWSPDGTQLACRSGTAEVFCSDIEIFSASGKLERTLPPVSGCHHVDNPSWSPDGQWLAFQSDLGNGKPDIFIIKIDGSNLTDLTKKTGFASSPQWSPDGKTLAFLCFTSWDQDIFKINIDGTGYKMVTKFSAEVQSFAWQPTPVLHPSPVTGLQASPGLKAGEVVLQWDNLNPPKSGSSEAVSYDFRYSKEPITEENWDTNKKIEQTIDIKSNKLEVAETFDLNTRWYFAAKTIDDTGNQSDISNVPWIIDTGFRPNPDGYSFCNGPMTPPLTLSSTCNEEWMFYPTPPADQDYTLDDMRKMFGDPSVCMFLDSNNHCLMSLGLDAFDPRALAWFNHVNVEAMNKGHCYGMNATAQIMYKGENYIGKNKEEPSSLQVGAKSTFDLSLQNSRRYISKLYVYQYADPVKSSTIFINRLDPNNQFNLSQIFELLQKSMLLLSFDPVILLIENPHSAHSLTPYAISDQTNGETKIWVYDSYSPDNDRQALKLDTHNHIITWEYLSEVKDGTGNPITLNSDFYDLGIVPMSIFASNLTAPWISNQNTNALWFTGDGHLLIENEKNQMIGFKDGQYINSLTGAYFTPIISDLGQEAEPIYTIPSTGNYRITLIGNTISQAPTASITQFGSKNVASIDNINIDSHTHDTITISTDSSQIIYQTNENKNLTMDLSIRSFDNNSYYEFKVQDADIKKGETVSLQTELDQGELIFDNSNASSGSYNLQIRHVDANGEKVAQYTNIPIDTKTTQAIDLSNWDATKPATLLIDQNNDGQFEIKKQLLPEGGVKNNQSSAIWIIIIGIVLLGTGILSITVATIRLRRLHPKG